MNSLVSEEIINRYNDAPCNSRGDFVLYWMTASRRLNWNFYLRMLWGKKILKRSPGPRQTLRVMIELNNKWALDGLDPNSYTGIFWCLERHDRPWGPRRPIFGTIRYMSSQRASRKLRMGRYLERYGDGALADVKTLDKPRGWVYRADI
jgi:deoxyribodipyrimidine photolyase